MLVAANKADNEKRELDAAEFYAFGWEETFAISASHGRGVGDLLDAVVWALPPESEAETARKAREAEAEAWATDMAAGRIEPFVDGRGRRRRRWRGRRRRRRRRRDGDAPGPMPMRPPAGTR